MSILLEKYCWHYHIHTIKLPQAPAKYTTLKLRTLHVSFLHRLDAFIENMFWNGTMFMVKQAVHNNLNITRWVKQEVNSLDVQRHLEHTAFPQTAISD